MRACKFRHSSLAHSNAVSPSTAASSSFIASDDEAVSHAAAAEESKFIRKKAADKRPLVKAKDSSTVLDQSAAL